MSEENEETKSEKNKEKEEKLEDDIEFTEDRISKKEIEETGEKIDSGLTDTMVGILSELLEARSDINIYIALNELEEASSEKIAEETGLYPKKVENVLEDLEERGIVKSKTIEEEKIYSPITTSEITTKISEKIGQGVGSILELREETKKTFDAGPYRLTVEKKEENEESEKLDTSL